MEWRVLRVGGNEKEGWRGWNRQGGGEEWQREVHFQWN